MPRSPFTSIGRVILSWPGTSGAASATSVSGSPEGEMSLSSTGADRRTGADVDAIRRGHRGVVGRGLPLADRDLALDAGAGAVADRVVDQLRVGRQAALPRGDAQPPTVDDRDVDLAGVVGHRVLHREQAAGGVEVVGQDVDDAGRLAEDGQGVGHGHRVAGLFGRGRTSMRTCLRVEGGVAEGRVVLEEVGARLVAGERDDAGLLVGLDRGAVLRRDLAAQASARRWGAGVGAGQVVERAGGS